MNHHARSFFIVFLFALAIPLLAQTPAGTLAGRITDESTRLMLGGARVSVVGTPLETYADVSGRYTLANVPSGPQTLVVSYVGYGEQRQAVAVAAGSVTEADFAFGRDVVQ